VAVAQEGHEDLREVRGVRPAVLVLVELVEELLQLLDLVLLQAPLLVSLERRCRVASVACIARKDCPAMVVFCGAGKPVLG